MAEAPPTKWRGRRPEELTLGTALYRRCSPPTLALNPHFSQTLRWSRPAGRLRDSAFVTPKNGVHLCNVYSAEWLAIRPNVQTALKIHALSRCRTKLRHLVSAASI